MQVEGFTITQFFQVPKCCDGLTNFDLVFYDYSILPGTKIIPEFSKLSIGFTITQFFQVPK